MVTCRIGVDIGGTFTDFVIYRPETGKLETFKLLSTPHDPAEAVLAGLRFITRIALMPVIGAAYLLVNFGAGLTLLLLALFVLALIFTVQTARRKFRKSVQVKVVA